MIKKILKIENNKLIETNNTISIKEIISNYTKYKYNNIKYLYSYFCNIAPINDLDSGSDFVKLNFFENIFISFMKFMNKLSFEKIFYYLIGISTIFMFIFTILTYFKLI